MTTAIDALEREVTERRRLEQVVREQALLLAAAVDGIARLDDACRYVEVNGAFAAMLDDDAGALSERSWLETVHADDRDSARAAFETARGGSAATAELRVLRRDQSSVPARATLITVPAADTPPVHYVVLRDLSERWRAEAEIRAIRQAADAASRAKGDFVANMSHEIRTPLNGIVGMTELALGTDLNAEQRGYLETIMASADSLTQLINDILDLSKIEARKLDLESVPFDLRAMVDETMRVLALGAHQKGLELACDVPRDVPTTLVGDPARLRQIITNLVGNAIKFTDRGEIVVRIAATRADGDDDVSLHVTVADTGTGIPREKHRAIFDAFTQGDTSTARQHGGTGLGLAISMQLVEMMGGRMWVESEPGVGSTFHFIARFGAPATSVAAVPPAPVMLDALPVLVADDNATQRRIIAELLRGWHMRPTLVASGEAALKAVARARRQDRPFALLVLDAGMSDVDGFTVAERVRAHPGAAPPTIMLLSPASAGANRARAAAIGVGGMLTKPVRAADLLASILAALGAPRIVSETPTTRIEASRGPKLHVLVAEDNPINQQIVCRYLGKGGHTVVIVSDGHAALEAVSRQSFDVVFMDVQMPGMDGLTATAEIRRRERGTGRHVPIVAMTARAMKGDRERCLAVGMDDYVAKPIRTGALLEIVTRIAAERPRRRHPVNRATPAIDRAAVFTLVDDDTEMLEEIVTRFLTHGPHMLADIRRAGARRDADALESAGHTLKGSAGFFAATVLVELARTLETMARTGDWTAIDATIVELTDELDRVSAALAELTAPANPNGVSLGASA